MSYLSTITGTTTDTFFFFFLTHIKAMQWWVEQLQGITADTQQLLLVCWENTAITQMSNLTKKMMQAFLVLMSHQSGDQIRTRQVGDTTRLSLRNVTETCGQRRPYESPNSGVKLARS